MKPATADPHYRIHCIRIIPLWGSPIYLTDHPRDLVISGNTYQTESGYEFTGLAAEGNMAPGVIDLSGIADIAGIGYDQIVSGVFDNARVYCFATTWRNPVVDEEPLGVAFMGKITLADDRYTAELMMMVDALNQSVGLTYTASCQKKFGGQEFAGCKVALGPLIKTGALTKVTSNSVFGDSARIEVTDYFGEGTIVFTSGANAGLKPQEIKTFIGIKTGTITAITKAASAVVTVGAHTFIVGDEILFASVGGMTQINALTGLITAVTATGFTVAINSSAFSVYTSGGTVATLAGMITTHEPFYYPVAVGDVYTIIPGCRKRLQDCRDKWNNVVNFGGFSNIPTSSEYLTRGTNS